MTDSIHMRTLNAANDTWLQNTAVQQATKNDKKFLNTPTLGLHLWCSRKVCPMIKRKEGKCVRQKGAESTDIAQLFGDNKLGNNRLSTVSHKRLYLTHNICTIIISQRQVTKQKR